MGNLKSQDIAEGVIRAFQRGASRVDVIYNAHAACVDMAVNDEVPMPSA